MSCCRMFICILLNQLCIIISFVLYCTSFTNKKLQIKFFLYICDLTFLISPKNDFLCISYDYDQPAYRKVYKISKYLLFTRRILRNLTIFIQQFCLVTWVTSSYALKVFYILELFIIVMNFSQYFEPFLS